MNIFEAGRHGQLGKVKLIFPTRSDHYCVSSQNFLVHRKKFALQFLLVGDRVLGKKTTFFQNELTNQII